jgi:predicted acyl esterase
MRILWDEPIPADDGITLRADVFLPEDDGAFPTILSYGPYGKGLAFQEGYKAQWDYMIERYPEVAESTSSTFQNWEVVDPEKWVPDGYAIVRVDSRGAGRSPGYLNVWSARETLDLYQCVEWAAVQSWSTGRVGLAGISYYAMNQYQVAALQPPHLTAICPWEGASDWYREFARHGGILCRFAEDWYGRQVETVQHGVGERGYRSKITGELVAGPDTVEGAELEERRADLAHDVKSRSTIDDWHMSRNPDWTQVVVPMLSAANWGGQGLHLRGNIEAFTQAASAEKWLEVHGDAHWVDFYTNRGVELQKRFFAHYLKGEDNGWDEQPRVMLRVRHTDGTFHERSEGEWPIARTVWTPHYLNEEGGLGFDPDLAGSTLSYDPAGPGITFTTPPLTATTEVTGPLAASLHISSTTTDADLFLVVRVFDPADDEVTFMGALDPNTPMAQGWLRASHRRLDPSASLPYRPFHSHTDVEPLEPGEIYRLDVEIWPTSIIIPAGYRMALTVRGNDYRYEGELDDFARSFHYAGRGIGPFRHDDPTDRPADLSGGVVTLHVGGDTPSHLLVPVVPPKPG